MTGGPRAHGELPIERLNRRCPAETFAFRTSAELPDPDPGFAQPRALAALARG